ncbi:uncharacterized protein B0I36DRAFT_333114 [Microdochium trichocladiopsis]|uniref:Microbial-type PARG catalytic domain-containing protein n=1 Tax=Microdochium trichocladiopsis TaxID=1682393 RepID=A0A9P8XV62_9PEZI|nr:uncharacterized protein B0I36DRAFT_333114 [Microdochium trichocladiopsis]KAH7020749.1 hypothetical protein B0I36DRAFT_333114 [Microdochium trichocladiopsis]
MFSKIRAKLRPLQGLGVPKEAGKSDSRPVKSGDRKGQSLAAIAEETIDVLPGILESLPDLDAASSTKYDLADLHPLDPLMCPGFQTLSEEGQQAGDMVGTRITVLNADSFDVAIGMQAPRDESGSEARQNDHRIAVLNLASDKNPGGGWLHGAAAQEEALCFRSSLILSLHQHYYPWSPRMGLYTRDVVIIRDAIDAGHGLLVPRMAPHDLPVVSVISIAGIRSPPLSQDRQHFEDPTDRELTKDKMRLCLRIAATEKHRHLVLGAIGCGAFANPPRHVASCWLEVLQEAEFVGGWWRTVSFAVYDSRNEGNFAVFKNSLHDKVV